MSDYTQDGQRDKWLDLAKKTLAQIQAIDKDTPATPTEEPEWWVQMNGVRRKLYTVLRLNTRRPPPAEVEDERSEGAT